MSERPQLLSGKEAIADVARAIRDSGQPFAFDLEFVSADRYVPDLCVVQLAWGDKDDPEIVAIDALEGGLDPVFEVIADESVTAVAHAPKQDLQLLSRRYRLVAANVIDTQIAAAFTGHGDQIGYGKLVKALVGVQLDKGAQFTDWKRRPLSERQIRYALADVRYLQEIWSRLCDDLEKRGRLDWVGQECTELMHSAATPTAPEEMYRSVSGAPALSGKSLGSLRAVAAWREETALSDNTPPSWILPDPAMVEVCKRQITKPEAIGKLRGVGSATVRKYGESVVAAVKRGADDIPPALPQRQQLAPAAQLRVGVCQSIVAARCIDEHMGPRFVGTRADVEALVRAHAENADGHGRLGEGWRRDFVGADLLAWLSGQLALRASADKPGGLTF